MCFLKFLWSLFNPLWHQQFVSVHSSFNRNSRWFSLIFYWLCRIFHLILSLMTKKDTFWCCWVFIKPSVTTFLLQTKGGVKTWAVGMGLWTLTPPSHVTITWTASQVGTWNRSNLREKFNRLWKSNVWSACRFLLWPETTRVQSSQQRAQQQMLRWLHVWGRWVCRTFRLWSREDYPSKIKRLTWWSCCLRVRSAHAHMDLDMVWCTDTCSQWYPAFMSVSDLLHLWRLQIVTLIQGSGNFASVHISLQVSVVMQSSTGSVAWPGGGVAAFCRTLSALTKEASSLYEDKEERKQENNHRDSGKVDRTAITRLTDQTTSCFWIRSLLHKQGKPLRFFGSFQVSTWGTIHSEKQLSENSFLLVRG